MAPRADRQTIDAIVFDLDGTLIDSVRSTAGALNTVLHEIGRPPLHVGAVRGMVGEGGRRTIEMGLDATGGRDGVDVDALVRRWQRAFLDHELGGITAYSGVAETLGSLERSGIACGVCTNKTKHLALASLDAVGLRSFFRAVVTPDDTEFRKPDGRHVLATVAALGADPARAVYVGDSEIDAAAAAGAGLPFMLVGHGYPKGPIADIQTAATIDTFGELESTLNRLPR